MDKYKVLIVVDAQNDFVTGSLGTPDAQKIILNIMDKIIQYRNESGNVYFTQDTHYEDYLEKQEGKNLPILHCQGDTWGWDFHKDVKWSELCLGARRPEIVQKDTFGYTGWVDLFEDDSLLENDEEGIESIEIVGLVTDICVISNVLILKSLLPEVKLIVDASCCAGTTPENHNAALQVMKSCQVEVINE